jgi:hypothetical protein
LAGKRIIITLSGEERLWVDGYSQAHKISMAEAVRQGLAILRRQEGQEPYQRLVEKIRGMWRQGDGLTYQQAMRSEWKES